MSSSSMISQLLRLFKLPIFLREVIHTILEYMVCGEREPASGHNEYINLLRSFNRKHLTAENIHLLKKILALRGQRRSFEEVSRLYHDFCIVFLQTQAKTMCLDSAVDFFL